MQLPFLTVFIFCFSQLVSAQDLEALSLQEQGYNAFVVVDNLDYTPFEEGLKSNHPEEAHQKLVDTIHAIYDELFPDFSRTKLLNSINLNIARFYFRHNDFGFAKTYFLKVLDSSDPIFPYTKSLETSERNAICLNLARIFIKEENYASATLYLNKSKKYHVEQECGNGIVDDQKRLQELYDICESGMANKKRP
ncbi:hypothetical protein [Flavobacterium sp. GCM10023249]|uniref:hypothetical protein n=1 Tax=unclassified Flavobacterium TaxID=196869 RepID=UPI0036159D1A